MVLLVTIKALGKSQASQHRQGKFWEDLAEKRRQLYNSTLEQVRQNAEAILGPGPGSWMSWGTQLKWIEVLMFTLMTCS